jgi:signal transduction histidine kinase/ligand-binding sensor domain-containing protein
MARENQGTDPSIHARQKAPLGTRVSVRVLLLLCALAAPARRLPIQVFGAAQGLPRNLVRCLVPGSNGFLWICTSEGLARFDGSRFRVFGPAEGLPSRSVIDLVPSRKGGFWVVTDRGVCRLPPGSRIGEPCTLLAIERRGGEYVGEFEDGCLFESRGGDTWVATTKVLFRVSQDGRRLERMLDTDDLVQGIMESPTGSVLISGERTVVEWRPGATPRQLAAFGGVPFPGAPDEMWISAPDGIERLFFRGDSRLIQHELAPDLGWSAFLRRRDGSIWVAGNTRLESRGLWRIETTGDGRLRAAEGYTQADGLPAGPIRLLAEDCEGTLWGSSDRYGIFRIIDSGFVSYDGQDGLGIARIATILEDPSGELLVSSPVPGKGPGLLKKERDGFQFKPMRYPAGQTYFGWASKQAILPAHDGEWWWAAGRSLLRFPKIARVEDLARVQPIAYDSQSPVGCLDVFRVMEDSAGDVWISCLSPENTFTRWERQTGRFHRWSKEEGWTGYPVTVVREGADGWLWIGSNNDVARFHNGHFESFPLTVAPPYAEVTDILIDHAGRVWIATAHAGVYRCDNPQDASPVFRNYTVREGLSSNGAGSLVEDEAGFVYVGTTRGVDRIDPRAAPEARRVRHFTPAEGLPDSEVGVAFRDRRGHLWFGTVRGLAEFDPSKAAPRRPPEVYVTRVRVRGEESPVPWEGAHSLALRLRSDRNQAEIEYAGLNLGAPNSLLYQYRLGDRDAGWSEPEERLSVNFAMLPRGASRFEVRAIDTEGQVSQAAGIDLYVESPLWLRWWFVALAGVATGALAAVLYNYRVRHLLAIERLRTRIATDLHDDMGSSLTQISILSELARKRSEPEVLSEIAEIARGLVADMSDIVWAISPNHDRFEGLVHRMRRFASDTLGGMDIVEFETGRAAGDGSVPLEIRRPLYLVFKEAVNNVARHSGAKKAWIRLEQDRWSVKLTVEDDGRGVDPQTASRGEGMASIRRRMKEIGGSAEWESGAGKGTRFVAVLPVRGPGARGRGPGGRLDG